MPLSFAKTACRTTVLFLDVKGWQGKKLLDVK